MDDVARLQAELLLLAFERNSRVNAALLAGIGESDLEFAAGGGWSIMKHLCHLAAFRSRWLARISPSHAERLLPVVEPNEAGADFRVLARSLDEVANAFREGDAAAMAAVEAALAERRPFQGYYQSHPTAFLVHILIHDAHHRGQIMSLLRQVGRSQWEMEQLEDASWPVWRE